MSEFQRYRSERPLVPGITSPSKMTYPVRVTILDYRLDYFEPGWHLSLEVRKVVSTVLHSTHHRTMSS